MVRWDDAHDGAEEVGDLSHSLGLTMPRQTACTRIMTIVHASVGGGC